VLPGRKSDLLMALWEAFEESDEIDEIDFTDDALGQTPQRRFKRQAQPLGRWNPGSDGPEHEGDFTDDPWGPTPHRRFEPFARSPVGLVEEALGYLPASSILRALWRHRPH